MKRQLLAVSGFAALLISPLVQAMNIHGDIHPDRYTFFLTPEGGNQLKQANDRLAKNPQAYTLDVNHTGIQPFKAVRWDSKPVKAVTCVLVDGVAFGRDATWSQCKDETGGEYFGNQGWPVRDYVAKSCEVGQSDCPVYLVLQTDPPTMRSDMVQFTPPPKAFYKPDANPAALKELKVKGCAIINEYLEKEHKATRCTSVESADITSSSNGNDYYEVGFTSSDNEKMKMKIMYYIKNAATKEYGYFVSRIWSAEDDKPVKVLPKAKAGEILAKLKQDGCDVINTYDEKNGCSAISSVENANNTFYIFYKDKRGESHRTDIIYNGETPVSITLNVESSTNSKVINLNTTSLDKTEYHYTDKEAVNGIINQLKVDGCEIINKKINECVKVLEVTHQPLKGVDWEDNYHITYELRPVHVQQQPALPGMEFSQKQEGYTPTNSAILHYKNNKLFSVRMSGG